MLDEETHGIAWIWHQYKETIASTRKIDLLSMAAHSDPHGVRQTERGIDCHHQNAPTGPRQGQCEGRGGGGLAHATTSRTYDDLH